MFNNVNLTCPAVEVPPPLFIASLAGPFHSVYIYDLQRLTIYICPTAVFTRRPCHSKAVRMCILHCLLQAHTLSPSRKFAAPHTISLQGLADSDESNHSFVLD